MNSKSDLNVESSNDFKVRRRPILIEIDLDRISKKEVFLAHSSMSFTIAKDREKIVFIDIDRSNDGLEEND